jgi:iron complex outermembrane receptor protein
MDRKNYQRLARGTVTATVYGPGTTGAAASQINPYYINPPGVTATSQSIQFDADGLLGNGAFNNSGTSNVYATGKVEYRFLSDWRITAMALAGKDFSYSETSGTLCTSCATLGLNGTTNGGGVTTTPSVAGTNIAVLSLPLTAANSLDVWDPLASNKTSAAVLKNLQDSYASTLSYNSIEQYRLSADGSIFELPGGSVRAALGAEYANYTLVQDVVTPNNTGPATLGSTSFKYGGHRFVTSFNGEIEIPIIGEANALPFVQKFDIDISGRIDH